MARSRRYFVPDLSPHDRPELKGVRFRYVFVAESPHVNEVTPERRLERRPLCGAAGKVWWSALGEILEQGGEGGDLSLRHFLKVCRKHRIAVLNAVQFPLDAGIVRHFKDADPMRTLGFSKQAGSGHYKRGSVACKRAVRDLRKRLLDPSFRGARIVSLGNDADWFIRQALSQEELAERYACKIAHPSAWWRRGGYYGRIAREKLRELLAV